MTANAPIRFTLQLTNSLDAPRTVVLEPWTGEYRLPAGARLDIVVEGTASSPVEIELVDDQIIIYSFQSTDAMLTAYRDGRELRSEHAPPAV